MHLLPFFNVLLNSLVALAFAVPQIVALIKDDDTIPGVFSGSSDKTVVTDITLAFNW